MRLVSHRTEPLKNGEIARDGDMDAVLLDFAAATADLEYVIPHSLGRIPQQIAIVLADVAGSVYFCRESDGTPLITAKKAHLKFSAAGNYRLRIC